MAIAKIHRWLRPSLKVGSRQAFCQGVSTLCALLGSVVVLASALTEELGVQRPTRLEYLAAGLISASVLLEVGNFRQRRRAVWRRATSSAASPQLSAWSWRQSLLLLGPALAAMGGFTALGSDAARHLGIVPRTLGGLPGVVFGCFVHFSWSHFGWNAIAFFLLGLCVLDVLRTTPSARRIARDMPEPACSVMQFALITAFIALSSGFCVWCLARPALHAGASGVVCGYVGLLLALTLRRPDVPLGSLLMVLGVVACYGGAVLLSRGPGGQAKCMLNGECFGRLSLYEACTSRTTSAEHHTFGFLSGLASVLFCLDRPGRESDEEGRVVSDEKTDIDESGAD